MKKLIILFSLLFAATGFASKRFEIIDESRNRIIPLNIYEGNGADLPVVIISHGYKLALNTQYSFIADALQARGYFVVSIQHELPNDPPLPVSGNLFERRKPIWERGVQNILFVISYLGKQYPELKGRKVVLIGHSNGGDMSMMFASKHKQSVAKLVSLDSLRYPFPSGVPVLHFAAEDTKADEGVVPAQGVRSIKVAGAKHMDFYDPGSSRVKEGVVKEIIQFLAE